MNISIFLPLLIAFHHDLEVKEEEYHLVVVGVVVGMYRFCDLSEEIPKEIQVHKLNIKIFQKRLIN